MTLAFAVRDGQVHLLRGSSRNPPSQFPLLVRRGAVRLSFAAGGTSPPKESTLLVVATTTRPVSLPVLPPRPATRGDCLTARRRFEVDTLHSRGSLPVPAAWGRDPKTGEGYPTDGKPDGANSCRPCPFAACKYHLGFEYNTSSGSLTPMLAEDDEGVVSELVRIEDTLDAVLDASHPAPLDTYSCALDLADVSAETGDVNLADVGTATHRTRERIRQVVDYATKTLRPLLGEIAARDGEDVRPGPDGRPAVIDPVTAFVYTSEGRKVPVLRRSGSKVQVACDLCNAPLVMREARVSTVALLLCKPCGR